MRTGPQVPQTNCTFDSAMRLSCSAIPPFMLRCGLGRTCFFTIMTCSTRSLLSFGNTRRTRPSLPLSRPVITFTVSFRRRSTRLCSVLTVLISVPSILLQYFWCERNNLQKLFLAQFTGNRAEDAGSDWLALLVDQYGCILIEANVSAVAPPILFVRAHDHCFYHRAFFHLAVGRSFFHAGCNHIAQTGAQSGRAAERQDNLQFAGAGIVGDLEPSSHHHSHSPSPFTLLRQPRSRAPARSCE